MAEGDLNLCHGANESLENAGLENAGFETHA